MSVSPHRTGRNGVGRAWGMNSSQSFLFGVIIAAALFMTLTLAFGCSTPPSDRSMAELPLLTADGQRRSLATDGRAMSAVWATPAERQARGEPWYASRADNTPAVVVGTRTPRLERAVTRTYDDLRTNNGRVTDNLSIRRRSITVQEVVTN
ncbi:MAG: hypothetical protein AAGB29_04140 [Planctomycetota bacterium]